MSTKKLMGVVENYRPDDLDEAKPVSLAEIASKQDFAGVANHLSGIGAARSRLEKQFYAMNYVADVATFFAAKKADPSSALGINAETGLVNYEAWFRGLAKARSKGIIESTDVVLDETHDMKDIKDLTKLVENYIDALEKFEKWFKKSFMPQFDFFMDAIERQINDNTQPNPDLTKLYPKFAPADKRKGTLSSLMYITNIVFQLETWVGEQISKSVDILRTMSVNRTADSAEREAKLQTLSMLRDAADSMRTSAKKFDRDLADAMDKGWVPFSVIKDYAKNATDSETFYRNVYGYLSHRMSNQQLESTDTAEAKAKAPKVITVTGAEWNKIRHDKNVKSIGYIGGRDGADHEVIYKDYTVKLFKWADEALVDAVAEMDEKNSLKSLGIDGKTVSKKNAEDVLLALSKQLGGGEANKLPEKGRKLVVSYAGMSDHIEVENVGNDKFKFTVV